MRKETHELIDEAFWRYAAFSGMMAILSVVVMGFLGTMLFQESADLRKRIDEIKDRRPVFKTQTVGHKAGNEP